MINLTVNNKKQAINIGVSQQRPIISLDISSGGQFQSASINGVPLRGALTYLDLFLVKGNVNTKAYWDLNPLYVPGIGEAVIYLDRQTIEGVNYPGIKIGDGNAYLVDLPFLSDDLCSEIMGVLSEHIGDTDIHVTTEEKTFWNNKLNCEVDDENIIFNRL